MRSPVASMLKAATASTHARVENTLRLGDDHIDETRIRLVIERFVGFWPVLEAGVDRWADARPELADRLDWPRRRRGERLRRDLAALGTSPAQIAWLPTAEPIWTGEPTDADVFGWLYVAEGSTLGGAVIERALRRGGRVFPALGAFTPYPEGPGPMWREYLAALEEWAGAAELRAMAVVDAASLCFEALSQWVSPLAVERVA